MGDVFLNCRQVCFGKGHSGPSEQHQAFVYSHGLRVQQLWGNHGNTFVSGLYTCLNRTTVGDQINLFVGFL